MKGNVIIHKDKLTKLPLYYQKKSKTNIPLAKQGFNTGGCPLCGCIITLYDQQRSEKTCADCGYVYDEVAYNPVGYDFVTAQLYTGSGFTQTEHKYYKTKKKKEFKFITSKERNLIYYTHIIEIIKIDLCLTSVEVQEVQNIIREIASLKKLHSRLNAEAIILGICRYVAKKHNKLSYVLRFRNNIYREYKLTKKEYNVIEKNIKKVLK